MFKTTPHPADACGVGHLLPQGEKGKSVALGLALALLAAPALAASPPGASSCSGCHRAGASVPAIHGKPAQDIVAAMAAFRSGERKATLMGRIAKGFTDAETAAIADWLAAQESEPAK